MMHWARKGPRSNKANCRVDSKWARGGKPVLAAGATHCAKRSQSAPHRPEESPAGRAVSVAAAGASAPNKANCPRATRKASTLWRTSYGELDSQRALAKQSQFGPGGGGRGLARPSVPPVGPIMRSRANRWAPWCTNEANNHRETASCAKQTQSAVAGCTNEANGPAEGPGGRTNEANSRERHRDIRLLASLRGRQTKPIAAQTAGGEGRKDGPCRRWDLSCETKPISGSSGLSVLLRCRSSHVDLSGGKDSKFSHFQLPNTPNEANFRKPAARWVWNPPP